EHASCSTIPIGAAAWRRPPAARPVSDNATLGGEPLSLCWPKPGPIWGTTPRLRKCIVRDGRSQLLQSVAGGPPFRFAPEARDRIVDPGSFGKLVHDNISIGIKSGGERVF